jgi:type IV fimbrial biogenesis protein FimT
MNMRARGFTLIELMIALSIFAILVLLALPVYATFMGNTQIRNAAENSLTGVRLAQATAIKANALAKFVIDAAGWTVYVWNDELADFDVLPVQSYLFAEGAPQTTRGLTPAGATRLVTFDGLGRVVPDANSLTRIDVTNTNITNARDLSVVISSIGGNAGIKLCDVAVLAPDPRACP